MKEADSDFVVVADQLWGRLVNALWLMTRDRARSEEVAQEALARLWENWDGVNSPTAWTFTVAFNLAKSRLRRERKELRAYQLAYSRSEVATHSDPRPNVDDNDIRNLLLALPRRQREAVVRRYYLDQSVKDIARGMRCAEGTVKSFLYRAHRTLESQLNLETISDG